MQDIEKYDSKQTQGGVSASVAIYGSGSSVSAQGSRTKANVDYAQVNQQSGFNIKESSTINVEENTHLKGGIINAQGDKANHSLTTGTLTTENIENRSDIKVSTVTAGASTDMSQMATMAVGAALSALGNMNESERSQTQAAISQNVNVQITDNEAQKQKTGKTAEETLQSLNRDVANANQKLEKQDLTQAQERQEMAQVIGELSQAGINHLVGDKLKEADKKRQEAEAIEKENPAKATALRAQAQAIEAEYGLGSNLQMGIRAATAALQGLATGNANQAAVGLLSPYANKLIKEQTTNADGTVNTEANLMAHAVLGAIEAYATGNNAAAGALGALTAEAAAPYLMQALYKTDKAENLTDSQKQNIANLSQIAAGLAGGVTGDSTADFVSGAEIGKRAVENNAITPETVWDAANIAIGVSSLSYNISEGNYGSAAIDAAGLLYDGMATAFPFLPAGASAGIDAYRASNTIKQSIDIGNDVAKATNAAHKAAKNPNNIVNNPAVTGTKVHRATGDILGEGYGQATKLSDSASSYFRGANRTTGRQPDMSWSGTRMWADLTTPNQWNAHLRKYQSQYGEGIPILYKPHVGVVNSYKLHSGASVILNGGEAGYNILIKDSEEK